MRREAFGPGRAIGWRREAFGNNEPPPEPMKRPLQPAARARWSDRVRAIGAALEDMTKLGGIEPDSGERKVHVGTLARLTKIPETSLRSILDECFTEIVVPGFVVGYGANWIYLAPAEPR